MKKINLTIDGQSVLAHEGATILEAAQKNNIHIPTLCQHPDLPPRAMCRLCLVEIEGGKGPVTSCNTKVAENMKVTTQSEKLVKLRQTNLELIFGEHSTRCATCIRGGKCLILPMLNEFGANIRRFPQRKQKFSRLHFGRIINLDEDKCIECGNCIQICEKMSVGYLQMTGNGENTKVQVKPDRPCISCGQCIMHCPVGTLLDDNSISEVGRAIKNPRQTVVFQISPAARIALSEEFNLSQGANIAGHLRAALYKINVDWVVDASIGADFASVAQARELVDRLENNRRLPIFSSSCPAWINFVELYHPELTVHLSQVRSPHIIMGGLIKQVFGRRANLNPYNVFVVSVMPCASKKTEIIQPELLHNGIKPVDAVLTTRDLIKMLKANQIDLSKISPEKPTSLLEYESGVGTLYDSSGGVMESVLRSAYRFITKADKLHYELSEFRGLSPIKEADIEIDNRIIKTVVVNGLASIEPVLSKLKQNFNAYNYIEVVACPGGCIGGGGQSLPINDEIRELYQQELYDLSKTNEIHFAHQNPTLKDVYRHEFKIVKFKNNILTRQYKKQKPTKPSLKKITEKVTLNI